MNENEINNALKTYFKEHKGKNNIKASINIYGCEKELQLMFFDNIVVEDDFVNFTKGNEFIAFVPNEAIQSISTKIMHFDK